MYKLFTLLSIAVLATYGTVFAQITISTNNYQPAPGTMSDYLYDANFDSTFFNSLLAGSGGPMVWDFSSRTYDSGQYWLSVTPADAPSIDSFPTGNMVLFAVLNGDSSWNVFNSQPGSFTNLGNVSHYLTYDYVTVFQDVSPNYVFPFSYNSTWTSHRTLYENAGVTYSYIYDTTSNVADAWGTATYGSNSVPCLRVVSNEKVLTKTYDNSNNLLDSTREYVTLVTFVGPGFQQLVTGSHSNVGLDTYLGTINSDFLNSPTGVQQIADGNLPKTFGLSQNYPNPFNPTTEIDLSLPTRSQVKLTVYDILGRAVDVLIDKPLAAGSYVVDWNGKNQAGEQVASGVYFYKLTAGQFSASRKMVLLK